MAEKNVKKDFFLHTSDTHLYNTFHITVALHSQQRQQESHWKDVRCVSVQVCVLTSCTPHEGRPNSPPDAAHKCSFFSLFLEDAPLRCFVASDIPRFFAHLKKKKEREKMATSRDVDRHFRGPGRQKSWRKGKTSGDATRKCSRD